MKKRHAQKLVVLALIIALLLNVPLILIYNKEGAVFGIPYLFIGIFSLWIVSIVVSFVIIKRHYE
ncbi:hypothetical protein NBRC110019_28510 [Neptunitalea chrysea]|uniref:DUF3311 domain-containing protein n=1 Tax=Neptunitalea chrysea TaxID=1647581 RepID=A0A9W6EUR0_9FLAO|nr:hypothetical protein NBRC110019_28510 [Neptunitalea chrysea]